MTSAARRRRARRLGRLPRGRGARSARLYLCVPPLKGSGPLMNLLGLVAGARDPRGHPAGTGPRRGSPWYLLRRSAPRCSGSATSTRTATRCCSAREVPFPSLGDARYVSMYPVMMAGLLLLLRRRSAGAATAAALIDGLILTVGLALPSWIALMAPYLHLDDAVDGSARSSRSRTRSADVLLLGAVVRLALDAGRREPAFHLLIASIVLLLVTDFVYGLLTLHGHLRPPALARRRLDRLLPPLGRRRPAPLDGRARPAGRPAARSCSTPLPARRCSTCASLVAPAIGIVHDLSAATSTTPWCGRRRSSSSAWSSCAWPGSSASRSARSSASACSAPPAPSSSAATEPRGDRRGRAATRRARAHGRRPDLDDAALRRVPGGTGRRRAGAARRPPTRRRGRAAARPTRSRRSSCPRPRRTCSWSRWRRGAPSARCSSPRPRVLARRAVRASLRALATQVALALDSAVLSEEVHRRRGEARFGSLVRHASDLITVLGPDATVSYQSPSIERVLGYDADDWSGQRFDELAIAGGPRPARAAASPTRPPASATSRVVECTLRAPRRRRRQFEILSPT